MRSKSIIPVLFILILSLWPVMPFVESAGYGEENENLGQFTDDFENSDNVSVAINVINNQTLDCMELNYTLLSGKSYENLSKYVESDPVGDRIQFFNDYNVSLRYIRSVDTRLYEDYGVGFFDFFEWEYEIYFTNTVDLNAKIWFMLSNFTTNAFTQVSNHRRYLTAIMTNIGGTKQLDVIEGKSDGTQNKQSSIALNTLTWYYNKFKLNSTYFEVKIYSDSSRTVLVDTVSVSLAESKANYRYLLMSSLNTGTNFAMIGYIKNIWLGNYTGGYETDGYFTTEDYLKYTTGNTLALLTNTSIPSGTSMTVQFSNDNATWVDNEGSVGGTPVLDGFYAIDLRDLNYTDSFKMYNLTTTEATITPRLFQSRLITTNGTAGAGPPGPGPTVIQNVTGEWIYYNLTTINVIVGTHDSGDLNSTLDIDADTFDVSETVGAPAWLISFNWTNVNQDASCLWVVVNSFYDGNLRHDIDLQLYNFTGTSWTTISLMPDMIDYEWINASIYDLRIPNDYVNSSGAVLGRIIHSDPGNINHDIQIEFLKLYAFVPSEVTAPTITEDNFFWVFIAIVLSIITALLMWLKYEHNNN